MLSRIFANVLMICLLHSQGDRFIPDRSSMDFDMAYYLLTEPRKEKENMAVASPSKEAYRKLLADTLLSNRSRILSFKSKPPAPSEGICNEFSSNVTSAAQTKPARQRRYIPQVGSLLRLHLDLSRINKLRYFAKFSSYISFFFSSQLRGH